jgi:hypothetical protein
LYVQILRSAPFRLCSNSAREALRIYIHRDDILPSQQGVPPRIWGNPCPRPQALSRAARLRAQEYQGTSEARVRLRCIRGREYVVCGCYCRTQPWRESRHGFPCDRRCRG